MTRTRRAQTMAGWRSAAVLLAVLAQGCAGPGFLADLFKGPGKVKAQYTLPDQPTLILVDDPQHLLGGPAMPGVVANNIAYHFQQQKKPVINAPLISQQALDTYAATHGDQFAATPIDQVGRDLGADTVLYVLVKSVEMNVAGSVYHPEAAVEVKVIDALDGQRLWPTAGKLADTSRSPPGHELVVEMPHRDTLQQAPGPGTRRLIDRELAEKIGLEVSRLFYDWKRPERGEDLP